MEKGLVSIITPCYNGETFIKRYFESIIKQTYPNIEIIFINDGSKDNTEKIVKEYESKFMEKGYRFKYIYQENAGQAAALNKGLKIFNGEYLTWPDSDDTLTEDSIEKKVMFLEQHEEYGFVRTPANIIDEETGKLIGTLEPQKYPIKEKIFENLIFVDDVWFTPGCYMVKATEFLKANPKREIYESRGGQNWQMLLPMAYYNSCGYLTEKLCNYYYRKDSHSHADQKNEKKELNKINIQKDILFNVLDELKEKQNYEKKINDYYERRVFDIAYECKDKQLLIKSYMNLKNKGKVDFRTKIIFLMGKYKFIDIIISKCIKIKRKLGNK